MDKFLIVGLGNPGSQYAHTRHNIGYDVLQNFAARHQAFFSAGKLAEVAEVKLKGKMLVCIKPTTYMNLSGKAFKYWMDKEKIGLENTLTIVDELALPLNKLRLKPGGSDGGHNGLRDIIITLNSDKFPRLRFGIGNNYPKGLQAEFVLSKWFKEEVETVNKKIESCAEIIESFVLAGLQRSMNIYNNMEF